MGDRLTQLQQAVDQVTSCANILNLRKLTFRKLANQFVACFYFLERHHDLEQFGPSDKIPDLKPEQPKEGKPRPPHRIARLMNHSD